MNTATDEVVAVVVEAVIEALDRGKGIIDINKLDEKLRQILEGAAIDVNRLPALQESLSDPPGRRGTTRADVHYHPENEPAIDRPKLFRHLKLDLGGSSLTYYSLCRGRPDQQPFVVLASRTTWDALSRLFLECNAALGTGNVPVALAWWKDVKFYQSDLAPDNSVLFATRLPLRFEEPFKWAERTWLSILVNIGDLPYYADEGDKPS